ncbi:O-methyltransferase [Neobacillus sp. SM06]|uniref:O-methyltransferase n=1 Tax=Neobacillus sp. SM06 TaxID=3422492 RepID=UPI003D2C3B8F
MQNEKLHSYIESLIPKRDPLLDEMEQYAKAQNVPIMELAGIEAMLQILRVQNPKAILEVGTAIGYSALRIAAAVSTAKVVTIERDPERIETAKQFFKRSGKEDQVLLIEGDALETAEQVESFGPYDVIFIDAAKGQYKKFFQLYEPFLRSEGLIITDNVLFKGLVCEPEIESKRTKNLVKKIDEYNRWLMQHPDYVTTILPVGDGVAISKKRGDRE